MRRFAIVSVAAAVAACGLTFSPGDFEAPGAADSGPVLDATQSVTETGPSIDAGPIDAGPTVTRIALFGGRREAVAGEGKDPVNVAETMLTSIDSTGALGAITFDAPPPSPAAWTHATLLGGIVYVQTAGIVVQAPFTDRVSGAWTSLSFPTAPENGLIPWVLDPHGALSGTGNGTGPLLPPDTTPHPYLARFGDAGIEWFKLAAVTTVKRASTTLVRAGNHVFLLGGSTTTANPLDTPITGHSEVESATLADNGEPGDFHGTTPLPAITDAGNHAVYAPIAAATNDQLFVLGGLTSSAASSSLSDVALAAKVTATGDLDAWVVLPQLPSLLDAFAVVITPSWLVVFGGDNAPGKTTDEILRLAIHPDGSFGTSWEHAGTLPAKRSNLVGVIY